MKVSVESILDDKKVSAPSWWTTKPEALEAILRDFMRVAEAVWPEYTFFWMEPKPK